MTSTPFSLPNPPTLNTSHAGPNHEGIEPDAGYRIAQLVAGRYRLSQKLSTGSMATVWLARDVSLDFPVALKLLPKMTEAGFSQQSYLADRLLRESRTTAAVRHPSIVRVLDFGLNALHDPYLVMELLEGQCIGRRLRRSGRIVPERAVQVLLPIADGLAAVHTAGIVHRDIKPDNLFLAKDNHGRIQPKVIDFGLAKLPSSMPVHKLTGAGLLGTPEYMAPEQAIESSTVDERADVWSFSTVLYEMVSGALPFSGRTPAQIFRATLDRTAPSLTEVGVDPALASIVARGLRTDPADRWRSMASMGSALAEWLLSRGITDDITGASLRSQWPAPFVVPLPPIEKSSGNR